MKISKLCQYFLIMLMPVGFFGCASGPLRPAYTEPPGQRDIMHSDALKIPQLRNIEVKLWNIMVAEDARVEREAFAAFDGRLDYEQVTSAYSQLDRNINDLIYEYLGEIPDESEACRTLLTLPDGALVKFIKGQCQDGLIDGTAHIQVLFSNGHVADHWGVFHKGELTWAIIQDPSNGFLYVGSIKNSLYYGQAIMQVGNARWIGSFSEGIPKGWAVKFIKVEQTGKYMLQFAGQWDGYKLDGLGLYVKYRTEHIEPSTDRYVPADVFLGNYKQHKLQGLGGHFWHYSDGYYAGLFIGTYEGNVKNGIGKHNRYFKQEYTAREYFVPYHFRYGLYKNGKEEGRIISVNDEGGSNENEWVTERKAGEIVSSQQVRGKNDDDFWGRMVAATAGVIAFGNIGLPSDDALKLQAAFATDVFTDSNGQYTNAALADFKLRATQQTFAASNVGNFGAGSNNSKYKPVITANPTKQTTFPEAIKNTQAPTEFIGQYEYTSGEWHRRYCLNPDGTGLYWVQTLKDWSNPHSGYVFQEIDRQPIIAWTIQTGNNGELYRDNNGYMHIEYHLENGQDHPEASGLMGAPKHQEGGRRMGVLSIKGDVPYFNHAAKTIRSQCW